MAARETADGSSSRWAEGFVIFAGLMLMMIGSFHVITGLAAIFENEYFVVGANYLYEVDVTAWGWLHLIAGLIVVAAGFGIFNGATWARVVGITLAIFSAIANFFFIPYQPVWAILMITLAVLVIAALSAPPADNRMGA